MRLFSLAEANRELKENLISINQYGTVISDHIFFIKIAGSSEQRKKLTLNSLEYFFSLGI